ncbi:alkaline phosphatase [Thermobrachium celere]|uniref:Alkaline phosphatase n=1 Tax=Thermobrachium celere DSM 8682 TaxID=941824 RepID=R7RPM0_9CLOT|nr:alkaline phosphatase [Thermobrachium celere]CDF57268.1 Alkaline phosphatase [Thermobrachium celere DSM 8682]
MNSKSKKAINLLLSLVLSLSVLVSPITELNASAAGTTTKKVTTVTQKSTVHKRTGAKVTKRKVTKKVVKNVKKQPVVKKPVQKNNNVKPVVQEVRKAKNVIFLLGDGMGISHTTLARWYKGSNLAMDEIAAGVIRTYSAESIITDSAPAATAFATGIKSNDKLIGVYPEKIELPNKKTVDEKDAYKPIATILEAAKIKGKATGIVSTSQVQHASPAGFTAHVPHRELYYDIAMQQVYQGLDVVFGGGKQYLVPGGEKYNIPEEKGRKDGNDLIAELKKMGYAVVEDTKSMKETKANKVWGLFADDAMDHDLDRDPAKQPSLAEMTKKAIDILSKDKDGFFLFVEGSEIDWASHANDPVGVATEVIAFDNAVKVALDFAKSNKDTLVIVVSDHDNGGLSIGSKKTDSTYPSLPLADLINPLKKAKVTGKGIEKLFNEDKSNIAEVMKDYFGIEDLTAEEIEAIKKAPAGKVQSVVGPIISSRSTIGWTTTGHTGNDVVFYAYGPHAPKGTLENYQFAKIMADAMGIDLEDVNTELFIDLEEGLQYIPGAEADLDITDMANPVVEITKGKIKAELPVNTNILKINGKVYRLNGLTILSKSERIYVPLQALDIIYDAK